MVIEEIESELFKLQDVGYRDFQKNLIPTAPPETFIGVRTPALRAFAKQLLDDGRADAFLDALPHRYFDENQLHAFVISGIKTYPECLERLQAFLPYVDNWATCDQMSPKVFRKHRQELLGPIGEWLCSDRTFTVRFAVGMLMEHYLDADFKPEYPQWVAALKADAYYVHMMVAWYFATALAKQYPSVIPYLEEKRLDPRTHNKAIQKAIESRRITPEQTEYLRSLRVK